VCVCVWQMGLTDASDLVSVMGYTQEAHCKRRLKRILQNYPSKLSLQNYSLVPTVKETPFYQFCSNAVVLRHLNFGSLSLFLSWLVNRKPSSTNSPLTHLSPTIGLNQWQHQTQKRIWNCACCAWSDGNFVVWQESVVRSHQNDCALSYLKALMPFETCLPDSQR